MADPRLRQLTIKTGVVKRLTKEKTVCEKEVVIEQNRLERFKGQGADEHVLKKQEEVISECLMMLPDTLRRWAIGKQMALVSNMKISSCAFFLADWKQK